MKIAKCLAITFLILMSLKVIAQYETKFTVALDGSGDFTSIQEAIDHCKAFPDERITVFVKNGTYHEKVLVPSWNNRLSLIGESKEKTIITYDDYFDKIARGRNSTFFTYTLRVDADDFHAENLTIENGAGPVGQAVALHVEGDRCSFINCRLLGNQDTLYTAGENARQYFKNCYVEGTTDFIFGEATVIFDHCTLHIKSDSYITAASTPENVDFGYVFLNCKITADAEEVYLGRTWRSHAKTVFINTEMPKAIVPEGWNNWNKEEAKKQSFYAEYRSTGEGANPDGRAKWSHQLSEKQAKSYNIDNIFRGWYPSK